jgi:plasmid maintenance system killer protein
LQFAIVVKRKIAEKLGRFEAAQNLTGNYRITFGWSGESALGIDFEDYH